MFTFLPHRPKVFWMVWLIGELGICNCDLATLLSPSVLSVYSAPGQCLVPLTSYLAHVWTYISHICVSNIYMQWDGHIFSEHIYANMKYCVRFGCVLAHEYKCKVYIPTQHEGSVTLMCHVGAIFDQ